MLGMHPDWEARRILSRNLAFRQLALKDCMHEVDSKGGPRTQCVRTPFLLRRLRKS